MSVRQESKLDLAQALHPKYVRASRTQKGTILDEFVSVTHYHRNYAKELLLHGLPSPTSTSPTSTSPTSTSPTKQPKQTGKEKRERTHPYAGGRPTVYGSTVIEALKVAAQATGWICGKRLVAALPELVPALENEGALTLAPLDRQALLAMSAATIDRRLAPYRIVAKPKGICTTKPGSLLRSQVPIRTYTPWNEQQAGFVEIDLVAHCGESTAGTYLCTLNVVDVATGWTECAPVANKGQEAVFAALQRIRARLPFSLLGIDSDNGGEFINEQLIRYCRGEQITFTRCRAYHKNDQAHVEQKNGSVVRQLVGYDRYVSAAALSQMERVYELARVYVNAYLPGMKLVEKRREGATGKVSKHHDTPTTPYRRAVRAGVVSSEGQTRFEEQLRLAAPGPLSLRRKLDLELEKLWSLSVEASEVRIERLRSA